MSELMKCINPTCPNGFLPLSEFRELLGRGGGKLRVDARCKKCRNQMERESYARRREKLGHKLKIYNPDIVQRFWGKVDVQGPNECWGWLDHLNKEGYGTLRVMGKSMLAHRKVYGHKRL